jgi:hypothetical protein
LTRDDILRTLDELREDLKAHPEEWENQTLDDYLEGMRAWLEASRRTQEDAPSWELIANLLHAGRAYE